MRQLKGQLTFKNLKPKSPKGRGGRRPGAGRKRIPAADRGYVIHRQRPKLDNRTPAHVTLKLSADRPSLRKKEIFKTLRQAVATSRAKGLRIAHFSILSNHLHLLVESASTPKLAREIQSLAISFARRLNKITGNEGPVFAERYHMRPLRTPTETRNALKYVLSNESKHEGRGLGTFFINPFSSGHLFKEWPRLFGSKSDFEIDPGMHWSLDKLERWLEEAVSPPRTWLLREGWRRGR